MEPPGADLVGQGMRDLAAGHETLAALLVSIGARRICPVGGGTAVLHGRPGTTVDVDGGFDRDYEPDRVDVEPSHGIDPEPCRFPAIDPRSFRATVVELAR